MPAKRGPLRPHEEARDYRRKEPAEPLPGEPGLGHTFLIVTEGEVTERRYFEGVREKLQLSAVEVAVVHPACTDAVGLVRAAIDKRDRRRANDRRSLAIMGNAEGLGYDHVWVVFDTDVPGKQGQLKPALDLAIKEGIHVAHSTPCVEFWLFLHFGFSTGPLLESEEAVRSLARAWGQSHDKSDATFRRLWRDLVPNMSQAVARAEQVRKYHQGARTEFPANPSTDVDKLVRALNAAVQPPMRFL